MKIHAHARLRQGNEAQLSGEVSHPQSAQASLGSDEWTVIAAYFPECSDGPQSVSVTLHWRGKVIRLLSMDPERGPVPAAIGPVILAVPGEQMPGVPEGERQVRLGPEEAAKMRAEARRQP